MIPGPVWLDALTPKQARFAACLHLHLSSRGVETLVTCRSHECTADTLALHGVAPIVVGMYGGASLQGKLLADIERMRLLVNLVHERKPAALVSYPNPSASRVAFGLGLKYIAVSDTPHSLAASRLSLPLCDVLIAPSAISPEKFRGLLPAGTPVVTYEGVDEAMWVRDLKPNPEELRRMGLRAEEYVVVRPEEHQAAYYTWGEGGWIGIAEALRGRGLDVLVLPRYPEQRMEALRRGFRVPEGCVDGLSLAYYARAVVTGGGTMSREAALMGTPAFYTFPLELDVNKFLADVGFPLVHWRGGWDELAERISGLDAGEKLEYRARARTLLKRLETPEAKIMEALEKLFT